MSGNRVIEDAYAVIFLVSKQPRTIRDLCGLIGTNRERVTRFLEAAQAEGLVSVVGEKQQGRKGIPSKLYGVPQ